MRAKVAVLAGFCWFANFAFANAFHISQLPKGADVTLPLPATTIIPLGERVTLSATDMPQSISLKLPAGASPVTVSVFDPKSERVQYLDLKSGAASLYSFRALNSIVLIPKSANGSAGGTIQVESDKPLTIAH